MFASSRFALSPGRYALLVAVCMAAGIGLRVDALRTGFVADDYAQLGMLTGDYLVPRSPLNLFNFSDGTSEEGLALMRGGFYPWWSHPELRLSMLRPLASAMIGLDFFLFENYALAYHLHTLAWWIAMLAVIALLLYRLLPGGVALLAILFIALDEAQGVPLAWIANRCALVSTTLMVLALLAYVRFREAGRTREGWIACGLTCVALGFGEYVLPALGYFVAYELLGPHRHDELGKAKLPSSRELLSMLKPLSFVIAPCALYVVLRPLLGHGPQHSGVYLTPDADGVAFVIALIERIPVLVADLLLGFRAEFWTFGFPFAPGLHARGWVSDAWLESQEPWRRVHIAGGVLAIVAVLLFAWLLPKSRELRSLRFLLLGSVLSIAPVVGSFPSSRLLLVTLIGFMPVAAELVLRGFARLRDRSLPAVGAAACALLLLAWLTAAPAWLTHVEVTGLSGGARAVRRAVMAMDVDPERFAKQRIVMLSALEGGTSMYIPLMRKRHGLPAPERCWVLSLTAARHVMLRDGLKTFRLAPMDGRTMLTTTPEQLFRSPNEPLAVGDEIDLDGMVVRVMTMTEEHPTSIAVELDVPLEDPSLLFLIPTERGFERFEVPAVGHAAIAPFPRVPL